MTPGAEVCPGPDFHRAHTASLDALASFVNALIVDPDRARLDPEALTSDLRPFGTRLVQLAKYVNEGRELASRLSNGDLSVMSLESLSGNPLIPPLEVIRDTLIRPLKLSANAQTGELSLQDNDQSDYAKAFAQAIVDLHERQRALEHSAYTDSLTGAGNRAAYERRIEELWEQGCPFSMAFVDIDNLKACNDHFGHEEGDRYITQTFLYLSLYFSGGVYRIGGDEFIVIAPDMTEEDLALNLEQCRTSLVENSSSPADPMVFSFSYGCSRANMEYGDTREQMTLDADRKMYAYKLAHKNASSPLRAGSRPDPAVNTFGVEDRIFEALSMASPGRYLFIHNIDANESHWSPNVVRDLGLPAEHICDTEAVFRGLVHPDDLESFTCDLHGVMFSGKHRRSTQYRVRDAQGRYVMCEAKGYRLDGDGLRPSLYVGVVVNHNMAETSDPITGLPNIRGLLTAVGDCRQAGTPAGFVVLRVEGVGRLNSLHGYIAGDRVLSEIALRLVTHALGQAQAFRSRGARFCLVAEGIDPAGLTALVNKMRAVLAEPISMGSEGSYVPSVRLASMHCPVVTQQPNAVLRELDARLDRQGVDEGLCVLDARMPDAAVAGMKPTEEYERDDCERVDALTHLSCGNGFLHRCRAFREAHPFEPCNLVRIDLGHLHMFNEWYGRDAGDALLAEVGEALVRFEGDGKGIAGYWGEDDFTLLVSSEAVAVDVLLARLDRVVARHDDALGFRPSAGVYPLDPDEEVGMEQCARALFANDCAKFDYKERIAYFNLVQYMRRERENSLLARFPHALDSGEVTFFIQPQCDITTGRIVGGEALARWREPNGTLVSPAEFVPALEESGFIVMLDKYIWHAVFRWLRTRIDEGKPVVPISLNISRTDAVSFDVAGHIGSLMRKYDVPVNLVKLEITETAYSQEQTVVDTLAGRLKSMGLCVYMDDFGSGQSSLNTLKTMKVDVIKLDRSFMPKVPDEVERCTSIISSVVSMARSLELPIIVEGVETAEHVGLLNSMGVHYAQGFYYWKPMPREEFETLLAGPELALSHGLRKAGV